MSTYPTEEFWKLTWYDKTTKMWHFEDEEGNCVALTDEQNLEMRKRLFDLKEEIAVWAGEYT